MQYSVKVFYYSIILADIRTSKTRAVFTRSQFSFVRLCKLCRRRGGGASADLQNVPSKPSAARVNFLDSGKFLV